MEWSSIMIVALVIMGKPKMRHACFAPLSASCDAILRKMTKNEIQFYGHTISNLGLDLLCSLQDVVIYCLAYSTPLMSIGKRHDSFFSGSSGPSERSQRRWKATLSMTRDHRICLSVCLFVFTNHHLGL